MTEIASLQAQSKKWKQINHELQNIYDTLASKPTKEQWYFTIQIKMLHSKALEYTAGFDEKIKQIQRKYLE